MFWSDETKVNRFQSDGKVWCWSNYDTNAINENIVSRKVKHGGGCVMSWFGDALVGMLEWCWLFMQNQHQPRWIKPSTKKFYKRIFLKKILIWKSSHFPAWQRAQTHFKTVKEWLGNQDFEVLQWPSQSPDLNPKLRLMEWPISVIKSKNLCRK